MAYSTLSLIILETTPADQEGSASASLQLSSVLGSALGTGLCGAIIRLVAVADGVPRSGIILVDILIIADIGFAILTPLDYQVDRSKSLHNSARLRRVKEAWL